MKKIALTCAVIISAMTAFAQAENSTINTKLMAENRAKEMKQEYYLNDAQYQKALTIETEFYAKARHADGTPTRLDEMKGYNEKRDAAYKQLLPVDQWAKYNARQQRSMKASMPENTMPPAPSSATKR